MKSILITGCSRGIGLEIVKQLTAHEDAPEIILATCRNPSEAKVGFIFYFHEFFSLSVYCFLRYIRILIYFTCQDLQKLSEQNKTIHILKLGKFLNGFKSDLTYT